MKRTRIELAAIGDWKNLLLATWRAASGKRARREVQHFTANIDANLASLRKEIFSETVSFGPSERFKILDPKPRIIHAPCFRDRVLHHAVIAHVGPVLDRSLIDDTFACRTGKGTLAAIKRAQQHIQRFAWHAKMDVAQYFASINHQCLKQQLRRKIKGSEVLRLLDRIINSHSTDSARGLPIGALTSQHFANFYLGCLDRRILEDTSVRAYVRYMDDFVFWCDSKAAVMNLVPTVTDFLQSELELAPKPTTQIQRSRYGLTICGFRVYAGSLRLAQSRKRRIRTRLDAWETAYREGRVSSGQLQQAYDAITGMVRHADASPWLRRLAYRRGIAHQLVDC